MDDVSAGAGPVRLVFHNNDDTPEDFVVEILRTVFGLAERDTTAFASLIDQQGKAACGPYPPPVANALLEVTQQRIRASGHRLLITRESADSDRCHLCGTAAPKNEVQLKGKTACLCGACVLAVAGASDHLQSDEFSFASEAIASHFAGIPRNQLATTMRQFPGHMRADVQIAARSSRSRAARIIAGSRGASRSTGCRRSTART
jgi:ATP-dependent Clp protease adapter protein ClpS